MKRTIIPFTTIESWLDARKSDLTSTEIAALFGLSNYHTQRSLYEEKKNGVRVEVVQTKQMRTGQVLEPVIANMVAEEKGWKITPYKEYVRLPDLRIGSSFDFKILEEGKEDIILEIKKVNRSVYKKWINSNSAIEPPAHIAMQTQHQMLVSGLSEVKIAVLFGVDDYEIIEYKADQRIQDLILKKAAEFWQSVDSGIAPAWDYDHEKDKILIEQLFGKPTEGKVMTEIPDEVGSLVESVLEAQAEIKSLEGIVDGHKARLIELTTGYEAVKGNNWKCSWTVSEGKPDSIITPEMVGQVIKGRKASKSFRITKSKQ
jgi:putative phage-type endonuclease